MAALGHPPARARAILERLPQDTPLVGAEIGVWKADLSIHLLHERPQLTLFMVDLWHHDPASKSKKVKNHKDDYWQDVLVQVGERVSFASERAKMVQSDSVAAAANATMLDFCFIDDDHSYAGCSRSLAAWFPKIKPGGLLCGHDYNWRSVRWAVLQFCGSHGLTVTRGKGNTWFAAIPTK